MKKTLLLTGIISILVLSACADTTDQNPSQTSPSDNQSTDIPATPDTSATPAQHSEADTAAFNGAVQLLDTTFCDKISDETYKQECVTSIGDKKNYDSAIATQNIALCDKILDKDKSEACKIDIDVNTQLGEKQEKFLEDLNAKNDLKEKIINSAIIADCKKLEDTELSYECERDILIRKAVDSQSINECDGASSEDLKKDCRFYAERML